MEFTHTPPAAEVTTSIEPQAVWSDRCHPRDPELRIVHVVDDESGSWVVYQHLYDDAPPGRPFLKTAAWLVKNYTPKQES